MKQFLLVLTAAVFCINNNLFSQAKLDGVYAGCEFSVSPLIGGGMNRRDVSVLLRPDGTFNDQMSLTDWKTHVTGNYEVNNGKVTLKYSKSNSYYSITKYGSLFGYGYELFKLQGNTLPPGYYAFTNGTSGGGPGSGMVFVGAMSQRGLNFDSNGHFSNSQSSAAVVAGDNVGGGSTRSSSGSGTYKLNQGVLTLTFSDGHTELHSFFCDLDSKTRMAVVDGRIFFSNDDDNNKAKNTKTTAAAQTANTSANPSTSMAPDGKSLLLKANAVHGGHKLNALKTARLTATVSGLKIIELVDVANNRVRVELWKNGKLSSVQQTEGDGGWQWNNGSKTALPANNIAQVKSTLYTGVLGLRKPLLDQMEIVGFKKVPNNNVYTIECKLNGVNYVFAINDQNQLTAYGYKLGDKTSFSILSDLRPVQGILMPFQEISTTGSQKLTIRYDNFEINPDLEAQAWSVPMGN